MSNPTNLGASNKLKYEKLIPKDIITGNIVKVKNKSANGAIKI